jgi:hypothetical protein
MTTRLCCGHILGDLEDEICLKLKDYYTDYDKAEFCRAVSFGCYCKECAAQYEKWGLVLHNEQEEDDWLSGVMPDEPE